jgi:hypothetical protein
MGKGFDPNAIENLAAVDRKIHKEINREWRKFNKQYKNPTAEQIRKQVTDIEKKFGANFFR